VIPNVRGEAPTARSVNFSSNHLAFFDTPDAPDLAVALASSRTGDGLTFPVAFVDKTGTTGARQYVRYGLLARNAAGGGSTVRHAWAGGRVKTQKK
jgi:hypothetical protein